MVAMLNAAYVLDSESLNIDHYKIRGWWLSFVTFLSFGAKRQIDSCLSVLPYFPNRLTGG